MSVQPGFDRGEPGGKRAGVQECTRGVAEMPGAIVVMDLSGEEPDAEVELGSGVEILIGGFGDS